MQQSALEFLACPVCKKSGLHLSTVESEGEEIIAGTLTCDPCGVEYSIKKGISQLLSPILKRNTAKTESAYSFLWGESDPGNGVGVFHYRRLMPLLPPGHLRGVVLDAGCGRGLDTVYLASIATRVIALDLSIKGTERTYSRTRRLKNVDVVRGDLQHIPLVGRTVDFIYSFGVLMYLDHNVS